MGDLRFFENYRIYEIIKFMKFINTVIFDNNYSNKKSIVLDGWMGGWMDGRKSRFKDCLQQSKNKFLLLGKLKLEL